MVNEKRTLNLKPLSSFVFFIVHGTSISQGATQTNRVLDEVFGVTLLCTLGTHRTLLFSFRVLLAGCPVSFNHFTFFENEPGKTE